jgi:hypothetical protein
MDGDKGLQSCEWKDLNSAEDAEKDQVALRISSDAMHFADK